MQQVIMLIVNMDIVDHCLAQLTFGLHVLPCNVNNITGIQPVIF